MNISFEVIGRLDQSSNPMTYQHREQTLKFFGIRYEKETGSKNKSLDNYHFIVRSEYDIYLSYRGHYQIVLCCHATPPPPKITL